MVTWKWICLKVIKWKEIIRACSRREICQILQMLKCVRSEESPKLKATVYRVIRPCFSAQCCCLLLQQTEYKSRQWCQVQIFFSLLARNMMIYVFENSTKESTNPSDDFSAWLLVKSNKSKSKKINQASVDSCHLIAHGDDGPHDFFEDVAGVVREHRSNVFHHEEVRPETKQQQCWPLVKASRSHDICREDLSLH